MRLPGVGRNRLCMLIMAMLFVAPATEAWATANLAHDKLYQCTTEILPGWTGLTDGVKDSDQAPACFASDNSAEFPKEIIIDLDSIYKVIKILVYNSLNGNARHIAVSTSLDLADFEKLREYYFPPDQVQPLIHSFAPRQARYIKITLYDTWRGGLNGDNCLYLREVEVYGEGPASPEPSESARDILRLAALQPPLVAPHSVRLFQRYCLQSQPRIVVGILGDSFAVSDHSDETYWVTLLVAQLRDRHDSAQAELRNLAARGQSPHKGVEQLSQLLEPEAVDILIVAYGTDAALAGVPAARFRREFQYLLTETFNRLPALVVVVTPPPFAYQRNLANYWQVEGKQTIQMAQIIEGVVSLTECALVRTAAVLGRQVDVIPKLYQDNITLSGEAHQALAGALSQLLGYNYSSD